MFVELSFGPVEAVDYILLCVPFYCFARLGWGRPYSPGLALWKTVGSAFCSDGSCHRPRCLDLKTFARTFNCKTCCRHVLASRSAAAANMWGAFGHFMTCKPHSSRPVLFRL